MNMAMGQTRRLAVSPYARRRARERTLPLETLRGSGPNGRILAADVLGFVSVAAPINRPDIAVSAAAPAVAASRIAAFATSIALGAQRDLLAALASTGKAFDIEDILLRAACRAFGEAPEAATVGNAPVALELARRQAVYATFPEMPLTSLRAMRLAALADNRDDAEKPASMSLRLLPASDIRPLMMPLLPGRAMRLTVSFNTAGDHAERLLTVDAASVDEATGVACLADLKSVSKLRFPSSSETLDRNRRCLASGEGSYYKNFDTGATRHVDHTVPTIDSLPRRTLGRANGPLYLQLADVLREPIGNGTFPVGGELPKEATIAEHFGVSLITVRQALRDLEADGLIRKRSAKPAVVTARNASVNLSWKFKNFADMAAFTKDAQLTVKSYRKEISPALQRHFGLGKDEAGYCLRGILSVGEQKKAQITSYFPPTVGAKLKREDFSDVLIFRSLQRHLGLRLDVAHVTVRAEIADEGIAADLGVALGSAILTVEMLYQSANQQSVEFTIARHPADLFSITYDAPNDLA